MTNEIDERSASRYQRALAASRELAAAQRAAAETGEHRVRAEIELDRQLRALSKCSGLGPATWWPRLRGLLADRQLSATEAVRRARGEAGATALTHKTAVERLLLVQAWADDLPAARETAAASLTGANAEPARALLLEADELSKALFTAQSAHSLATQLCSELWTASRWSTYDTFLGGGIGASGMKRLSIDSAGQASQELVTLLAGLRAQLQDLGAPTAYFGVQMDNSTASRNVWVDDILSDLETHQRIGDSRKRALSLVVGLDQLIARLGERRMTVAARLDVLIAMAQR